MKEKGTEEFDSSAAAAVTACYYYCGCDVVLDFIFDEFLATHSQNDTTVPQQNKLFALCVYALVFA